MHPLALHTVRLRVLNGLIAAQNAGLYNAIRIFIEEGSTMRPRWLLFHYGASLTGGIRQEINSLIFGTQQCLQNTSLGTLSWELSYSIWIKRCRNVAPIRSANLVSKKVCIVARRKRAQTSRTLPTSRKPVSSGEYHCGDASYN